ncbi:MAG: hypothetical protein WC838_06045, partial [Candidatus Margulisiibacteriota bacterium]
DRPIVTAIRNNMADIIRLTDLKAFNHADFADTLCGILSAAGLNQEQVTRAQSWFTRVNTRNEQEIVITQTALNSGIEERFAPHIAIDMVQEIWKAIDLNQIGELGHRVLNGNATTEEEAEFRALVQTQGEGRYARNLISFSQGFQMNNEGMDAFLNGIRNNTGTINRQARVITGEWVEDIPVDSTNVPLRLNAYDQARLSIGLTQRGDADNTEGNLLYLLERMRALPETERQKSRIWQILQERSCGNAAVWSLPRPASAGAPAQLGAEIEQVVRTMFNKAVAAPENLSQLCQEVAQGVNPLSKDWVTRLKENLTKLLPKDSINIDRVAAVFDQWYALNAIRNHVAAPDKSNPGMVEDVRKLIQQNVFDDQNNKLSTELSRAISRTIAAHEPLTQDLFNSIQEIRRARRGISFDSAERIFWDEWYEDLEQTLLAPFDTANPDQNNLRGIIQAAGYSPVCIERIAHQAVDIALARYRECVLNNQAVAANILQKPARIMDGIRVLSDELRNDPSAQTEYARIGAEVRAANNLADTQRKAILAELQSNGLDAKQAQQSLGVIDNLIRRAVIDTAWNPNEYTNIGKRASRGYESNIFSFSEAIEPILGVLFDGQDLSFQAKLDPEEQTVVMVSRKNTAWDKDKPDVPNSGIISEHQLKNWDGAVSAAGANSINLRKLVGKYIEATGQMAAAEDEAKRWLLSRAEQIMNNSRPGDRADYFRRNNYELLDIGVWTPLADKFVQNGMLQRSVARANIFPRFGAWQQQIAGLFSNDINSEVLLVRQNITNEQRAELLSLGVPAELFSILNEAPSRTLPQLLDDLARPVSALASRSIPAQAMLCYWRDYGTEIRGSLNTNAGRLDYPSWMVELYNGMLSGNFHQEHFNTQDPQQIQSLIKDWFSLYIINEKAFTEDMRGFKSELTDEVHLGRTEPDKISTLLRKTVMATYAAERLDLRGGERYLRVPRDLEKKLRENIEISLAVPGREKVQRRMIAQQIANDLIVLRGTMTAEQSADELIRRWNLTPDDITPTALNPSPRLIGNDFSNFRSRLITYAQDIGVRLAARHVVGAMAALREGVNQKGLANVNTGADAAGRAGQYVRLAQAALQHAGGNLNGFGDVRRVCEDLVANAGRVPAEGGGLYAGFAGGAQLDNTERKALRTLVNTYLAEMEMDANREHQYQSTTNGCWWTLPAQRAIRPFETIRREFLGSEKQRLELMFDEARTGAEIAAWEISNLGIMRRGNWLAETMNYRGLELDYARAFTRVGDVLDQHRSGTEALIRRSAQVADRGNAPTINELSVQIEDRLNEDYNASFRRDHGLAVDTAVPLRHQFLNRNVYKLPYMEKTKARTQSNDDTDNKFNEEAYAATSQFHIADDGKILNSTVLINQAGQNSIDQSQPVARAINNMEHYWNQILINMRGYFQAMVPVGCFDDKNDEAYAEMATDKIYFQTMDPEARWKTTNAIASRIGSAQNFRKKSPVLSRVADLAVYGGGLAAYGLGGMTVLPLAIAWSYYLMTSPLKGNEVAMGSGNLSNTGVSKLTEVAVHRGYYFKRSLDLA